MGLSTAEKVGRYFDSWLLANFSAGSSAGGRRTRLGLPLGYGIKVKLSILCQRVVSRRHNSDATTARI